MATLVRPEPWSDAPEGFEFVAVEDDADFVTPAVGAGRCRANGGNGQKACGEPAVATIWRPIWRTSGRRKTAWDYCADHLYGRWIENGKVMHWRLRKVEP